MTADTCSFFGCDKPAAWLCRCANYHCEEHKVEAAPHLAPGHFWPLPLTADTAREFLFACGVDPDRAKREMMRRVRERLAEIDEVSP